MLETSCRSHFRLRSKQHGSVKMGLWGKLALAIVICAFLDHIKGDDDRAEKSRCFNGCSTQLHGSNICAASQLDCVSQVGIAGERTNEVNVTSVNIHSSSQSNYGINIQWQHKGATDVEGYVVHLHDPINSSSDICRSLLLNHSIPASQNRITFHLCSYNVIPNAKMKIDLTSLPKNKSSEVIVQLPSSLSDAVIGNDVTKWAPVLAAVVDEKSRKVTLVTSPVPAGLNITAVKIDVHSGNTVIFSGNITNSEPRLVFPVKVLSKVNLDFQVTTVSDQCPTGCQSIILRGVTLPSVIAPTPIVPTPIVKPTPKPTTAPPPTPRPRPKTPALQTTQHPPTDPSVIVKPAAEQKEFQRNIKIIVGTVLGFGALAAVVVVACFCVYRRRTSNHSTNFVLQRFGRRRGSDTSSLTDALDKQLPIVLLLYSYDCPAHERVVIQFANFLQFVANCDVLFDIWDQHQVASQGMHSWFQDKLDVAQYVIIICSTGARFKCARNRQQQMKQDRPIPDLFAWAVDQIGESMRKGKMDGDAYLRYLVVNFEYSSQSDIPPKLDTAFKFSLMKDIFNLYCHMQCMKSDCLPEGTNFDGVTEDTWYKTDCGQGLLEAIKEAKQFFLENPDWLAQTLEPCPPTASSASIPEESVNESRSGHQKKKFRSSRSRSLSSDSERDILHEQQQKKRQKKESKLRQTQSSHNSIDSPSDSRHESPVSSQEPSSSSSASSSSPLMLNSTHDKVLNKQVQPLPPVPVHGPVQRSISQPETAYQSQMAPRKPRSMGSLQRMGSVDIEFEEEDNEMDEFQLKKDIEFIQNFDSRSKNPSVGSLDPLGTLELRGYSPTEGFVDLGNNNDEASEHRAFASAPRRYHSPYLVIDFELHQQPIHRGSPDNLLDSSSNSNYGEPSLTNTAFEAIERPRPVSRFTQSPKHARSPDRPLLLPLKGHSGDQNALSSPTGLRTDIRKGHSDLGSPGPQPLSPVVLSSNPSSQSSKTSSPQHATAMPEQTSALSSNSAVLNSDLSALTDFANDVNIGFSNGSTSLSGQFSV